MTQTDEDRSIHLHITRDPKAHSASPPPIILLTLRIILKPLLQLPTQPPIRINLQLHLHHNPPILAPHRQPLPAPLKIKPHHTLPLLRPKKLLVTVPIPCISIALSRPTTWIVPPSHERRYQPSQGGGLKSGAEGSRAGAEGLEGSVVGVAGVVGAVEGNDDICEEAVDGACDYEGEDEGLGSVQG